MPEQIYISQLSLSHRDRTAEKEALKLIRQSEELELSLCTDRRADKYSSRASNIKFLLLRHKMYSLLIFLTKLKDKA